MQTRRGHMRSNLYTLTPFAHVSTAETGILERELCPPIKTESFQDSSTKDIREAHTFCAALPPEPNPASVDPLPPDVAALVADISREMRDTAPKSTLTRVGRVMAGSHSQVDMYKTVQQARAITRRRLSRIRKRASSGQACAMPYFLACLARAVGMVPTRDAVPVAVSFAEAPLPIVPVAPPVRPAAARDDERAMFWQAVNEACGVGDPRAFVSLCRRAAPFPDTQWAIRLCREAQKR